MIKIKVINNVGISSCQFMPRPRVQEWTCVPISRNLSCFTPWNARLVPTGLHIALPDGYEAQIRPRSGLALKKGITVLNSPGTIDADYRGEVMVLLINFSNEDFIIQDGERIAQMVIARYEQGEFVEVSDAR